MKFSVTGGKVILSQRNIQLKGLCIFFGKLFVDFKSIRINGLSLRIKVMLHIQVAEILFVVGHIALECLRFNLSQILKSVDGIFIQGFTVGITHGRGIQEAKLRNGVRRVNHINVWIAVAKPSIQV